MASERTSHFTPFLTQPVGRGGWKEREKKERGKLGESFKERESTFSIDYPAIGPSKLIPALRARGGYWDCRVSITVGGRGLLLLGYFLS